MTKPDAVARGRHDCYRLGRGPTASPQPDRPGLLAAARRVLERQAAVLAGVVDAGPATLTTAGLAVAGDSPPAPLGVAARVRFLEPIAATLAAWEADPQPDADPPTAAAAHALLRWAAGQLDLLPPGAPCRLPLLHALALGTWGLDAIPVVDAASLFGGSPPAADWLASRLAEEARELVHGRTFWEVAVLLAEPLQSLAWLTRGARSRGVRSIDLNSPRPAEPPTLPWPDGLDALRAALRPSATTGLLGSDAALPLRTLADLQRYAAMRDAAPEEVDVRGVRAVRLADLLAALGVPSHAQAPVHRADLPVLWQHADAAARRAWDARFLREFWGRPNFTRGCGASLLVPGPAVTGPKGWAVHFALSSEHLLLELPQGADAGRLRAQGQLWAIRDFTLRSTGDALQARCGIADLASAGGHSEIALVWREGANLPQVRCSGPRGERDARVLRAWAPQEDGPHPPPRVPA